MPATGAYEIPGFKFSPKAGADLSAAANQYKFVKLDANGDVVAIAAATDIPIGVLQNLPTSGQEAEVMVDGITKLQADAAISVGAIIGTSADGQADVKVLGTDLTEHVVGVALTPAAAAGNYFSALIRCGIASRGN
jgi:hypothetical protein